MSSYSVVATSSRVFFYSQMLNLIALIYLAPKMVERHHIETDTSIFPADWV